MATSVSVKHYLSRDPERVYERDGLFVAESVRPSSAWMFVHEVTLGDETDPAAVEAILQEVQDESGVRFKRLADRLFELAPAYSFAQVEVLV